jgi:hypothetical protein
MAIAANQFTHDNVAAEMRLSTKDLARLEAVRLMQTVGCARTVDERV